MALHLEHTGDGVLAIDNSPLATKTCRGRGVKNAKVLSLTGVRRRLGRSDTIVMLANASRVLKPGGSFYIWDGYANLGNYPGPLAPHSTNKDNANAA